MHVTLSQFSRGRLLWVFGFVFAVFLSIWIADLRYPLNADPMGYATLSRNLWETGRYAIREKADDVFVPGFPIVLYPFIAALGMDLGPKFASLVFGILWALAAYWFLAEECEDQPEVPLMALGLLTLAFPTTWLLGVGNADMLYGTLFFVTLILWRRVRENMERWWLLGFLLGCAMLTRYMGVGLLAIIAADVLLWRRRLLRDPRLWLLGTIALCMFSAWFIRHWLVFGNFFGTFHVKLQLEDPLPLWKRIPQNVWFYLNPAHSLTLFAPLFLVGLYVAGRRHAFLLLVLPLALILCYALPAVTTRYMTSIVPILYCFVAFGIVSLARRSRTWAVITLLWCAAAAVTHVGLTCMYTLPRCNAAVDGWHLSFVPPSLGFAQEVAESIQEEVDWINVHAPQGARIISPVVLADDLPVWKDSGRLRGDLDLALLPSCAKPTYILRASSETWSGTTLLHRSLNTPVAEVLLMDPSECAQPLPYDAFAYRWD